MPGERGRPGPGGIAVRAMTPPVCVYVYILLYDFWTKLMFTLQGKRGPPGNIGKSGPMVSRNMLCFTFVSLLCTKKTIMTFWKSKLDA